MRSLPAGERQHDSVVDDSLAIHPGADVGLAHQVDHALLENAGADARLDVFARVPLEDDARNAVQAEEAREAQARRAAADDANLRSHVIVPCEGSPPRWPAARVVRRMQRSSAARAYRRRVGKATGAAFGMVAEHLRPSRT
jgi:hypothetical protein